jgi:uridine kinase
VQIPLQKPFIVGITGGSASGKTTLLRQLVSAFSPEELCLVSQDNYYRPLADQRPDDNGVINFDIPESINDTEFADDVRRLHRGETIQRLEYTFNNPDVVPKMLTFCPAPVIVLEGLFVFHFPEIAKELDLKVFVEAQEHVKLHRRIRRDNVERGYDLDDVMYRYLHHVAPSFDRYIKPYQHEADIIIPNNLHFERGLNVLIGFLKGVAHGARPQ